MLDDLVGAPCLQFDAVDICQTDNGPTIDVDGATATLLVGPHATNCESTLVSNVAHEAVHLHLTDGKQGDASGLEEGFAVHFELSAVERHYGAGERQRHIDHLPATYLTALRDYEHLLTLEFNPAKLVRQRHGALSGVSRRDLRRLFPGVSWWMSYRLARRRRMRSG
ncbi:MULTISPECIES: hypothetical protein [Rhodopirellula]|uniref:hypothetical protein n=1 Tax=Rhodopirellula TaxID=265488 RepID=UPI00257DFCC1|nr:hypothetical protein [Rhodopirellula sp. UBA1907]